MTAAPRGLPRAAPPEARDLRELPGARGGLPLYVRQVVEEARRVEIEPVRLRRGDPGLVLISVMRDEACMLDDFLAHYRALGVDRFAILDNGSVDGTAERLAAEPDVDLYQVRRRFLSPLKQGWINRTIARYGYDRWYVTADADEHLVLAGAVRSIGQAIALAERRGLRRLRGMLVDMYAPEPLFGPGGAGGPLAARFPLFDGTGWRETVCTQRLSRKGGPRPRVFASPEFAVDPELTKYPVFHIRQGEVFDNPHHLYPYAENFRSPCLVGILHYKFAPNFARKIAAAVAERSYFNDSVEYRAYSRALDAGRPVELVWPGTRRYAGPGDLVTSGLIEPLEAPALPRGGWTARLRRAAAALRTSVPATSAPARPAAGAPRSGC